MSDWRGEKATGERPGRTVAVDFDGEKTSESASESIVPFITLDESILSAFCHW